jgi:hypothetical protein
MRGWCTIGLSCLMGLGSSASGQATTGTRAYTLTTPVADLVALVRAQVFTDAGRYYPCRGNPSCSAWGQNIALSDPALTIDGARLVFSVKMVGTYALNPYIAPQVTGTLIVSGVRGQGRCRPIGRHVPGVRAGDAPAHGADGQPERGVRSGAVPRVGVARPAFAAAAASRVALRRPGGDAGAERADRRGGGHDHRGGDRSGGHTASGVLRGRELGR